MPDTGGMTANLLMVVAAAMIDINGRVLLQQRPAGKEFEGLWEFPGGKIEPGESPEGALARELREELAIAVRPADLTPIGFASAGLGNRHLILLLYAAASWQGEPIALEASDLAWISPCDMGALPMPPADVPLVKALLRWLAS